jgi:uroporphyrinogen-III decarboxylase
MMTPGLYLKKEISEWLDSMERIDRTGWICGLGHGIHKETPEDNVKLFVDMVRERFE